MRSYSKFNYPSRQPGNTLLTGIREDPRGAVLISGFFEPAEGRVRSFVYRGPLSGQGALYKRLFHELDFPSVPGRTVTSTNLYGPNVGPAPNTIEVVGNYTTAEQPGFTFGCLYQGSLDGSGIWRTLTPPGATQCIAHSTMGGFVVGNYVDTKPRAFLYDIYRECFYEITKCHTLSITAYGIWHRGGHRYTICGGLLPSDQPAAERGYLVDWDSKAGELSNYRTYSYKNDRALITHFDGITGAPDGGFNLTGDTISGRAERAFFAHVDRHGSARWEEIQVPPDRVTSGNTVLGSTVLGVFKTGGRIQGYLSKRVHLRK